MKNLTLSCTAVFALFSIVSSTTASTMNSEKTFEKLKIDLFKAIETGNKQAANNIMFFSAKRSAYRNILEVQNEEGNTPLLQAIEKKNAGMASLFIDWRARLNTQNNNGETALIRASALGCKNIVNDLLDANANVNIKTNEGSTALLETIKSNDMASILNEFRKDMSYKTYILGRISNWWQNWIYCDIANLLIEAYADINTADNEGITPLILAASLGQTEMVKKLIKAKAEVNLQDLTGRTALMAAVQEGYADVVKALINAQVDEKLVDTEGKAALDYAQDASHTQIITLLKSNEKQA